MEKSSEEESFQKKLFKELSEFARNNLKELKPAEQWLKNGDFDTLADVWQRAKESNWQRVVLIAWLASDEKIYTDKIEGFDPLILCPETHQQGILYYVILAGSNTNEPHPSLSLIRDALEEGKKAVAAEKLKKNNVPDVTASLEIFIENYCKEYGTISSKVKTLQSYARKEKTKLPKLAVKWKRGQAKLYYVKDLKQNWGKYRKVFPTLPELK